MRDDTAECPLCGRQVEMFNHPDLGRVLMGHRTEMPHTPETPWCQGGGRQLNDVFLAVVEIAPAHKAVSP